MKFECEKCKKELEYLDVVVTNVTAYGTVSLFDDGTIEDWDLDYKYDGSSDEYSCPHCGFTFPGNSEEQVVTPQLRAAARQVELADGSKGLPDSVSAV